MVGMLRRYISVFDAHVGQERVPGQSKPVPLHDAKAIRALVKFAEDFKPHDLILGGDILDCGVVSHHNAGKPGKTEGLRLLRDMTLARELVIEPLSAACTGKGRRVYHVGNHEAWIDDLLEKEPGLEDLLDLSKGLSLTKQWEVIPQGGLSNLGKLYFAHGDQIRGGEHVAKAAVVNFERSIVFGHHHTMQMATKTSAIDSELPKIGVASPCLCRKDPQYMGARPNRWAQGFGFGYVHPDGNFNHYTAIIVNGKTTIHGKEFCG
jgi:metallophosphoesterase superfamily enzyme